MLSKFDSLNNKLSVNRRSYQAHVSGRLLKILHWNKNIIQKLTNINHFKHTLREPTFGLPKQDKNPIENKFPAEEGNNLEYNMSHTKRKRPTRHARTAKAQIRLRISAIWSGPSLSANRIMDTIECIDGEEWPGCDFAHAQDDLNLRISRMFEDTFSFDMANMMYYAQPMTSDPSD